MCACVIWSQVLRALIMGHPGRAVTQAAIDRERRQTEEARREESKVATLMEASGRESVWEEGGGGGKGGRRGRPRDAACSLNTVWRHLTPWHAATRPWP